MSVYIISTHGEPVWDRKTTVPAAVSVRFYQPFGTPMPNDAGFSLQTALRHPQDQRSQAALDRHPQRALWNGPSDQQPEINLTGDNHDFYTGIVHADTGEIVEAIGTNKLVTLTGALAKIRAHADRTSGKDGAVVVHCLFCL